MKKKVAYKVLMWWCIALVIAGAIILATGNSWGILQIVISAGIAYSAYRKVKDYRGAAVKGEVKEKSVYGGKADGSYIPGANYYIVGGKKYKYSRDDLTEDEKISEQAGTVTRIIFEEEGLKLDKDGNPILDKDGNPIYRDGKHENESVAD